MSNQERNSGLTQLALPERPHIVLALNDWMLRESFAESLGEKLVDPQIEEVPTEHRFVQRVPDWIKDRPDMFIIGCQLRWTDPAPRWPLPPRQVRQEGYENAGVRCIGRLNNNKPLDRVPTVYFCSGSMVEEHSGTAALPESVYMGEFEDIDDYELNEQDLRRKLFF